MLFVRLFEGLETVGLEDFALLSLALSAGLLLGSATAMCVRPSRE